ncbi:LacI family DNA-binding transcriptional regulator [Planctomycetota bacterium]
MATQTDIAAKVGVHRTTVCRVLNRHPTHRVSPETVIRILRAAEELGYDPKNLRNNPERRTSERRDVNMDIDLAIVLNSGPVYDEGTARIKNLSFVGALLSNVKMRENHLPLEPFYARFTIKNTRARGLSFNADFTRMHTDGHLEFGIRFERLSTDVKEALGRILGGE